MTFQLHVNPLDPDIIAAETPEGETVYTVGNKDDDGYATNITEFRVIDLENVANYVSLNEDGSVVSAIDTTGLKMDFVWSDNYTKVSVSLVLNNGTDQLTQNIDLTEEISTDLDIFYSGSGQPPSKRSIAEYFAREITSEVQGTPKTLGLKRRQMPRSYANVLITVTSCGEPETNAKVYANALLDYSSTTGEHKGIAHYTGIQTATPGVYKIKIPTKPAPKVREVVDKICDSVKAVLSDACTFYGWLEEITSFQRHKPDALICFAVGRALPLAFPQLRLLRIYRFCKSIFKGFHALCKVEDICNKISKYVDPVLDYLEARQVLFTPTALFPRGYAIETQGKVISIPRGSSTITTYFAITDNQVSPKITTLNVSPPDPAPYQDYVVTVTYKCYSTDTVVSMTIVGTDGYSDGATCSGGPSCSLSVPGAVALVQDTVTVRIFHLGVAVLTRTLIIIF